MTTTPATVRARALAARDALAPTFPIATFVAANPLHGLEHLSFEDAARHVAATTGAASYLSEESYRERYRSGRITDAHLRTALLRRWPTAVGAEEAPNAQRPPDHATDPDVELSLATLLEGDVPAPTTRCVRTLTEATDLARGTQLAGAVDAMVATWCAAYLDQGQASWTMPHRHLGLYRAWRSLAPRDPAVRRLGGRAARRRLEGLPDDAAAAVAVLIGQWGLEEARQVEYFRATYRRLPGWASALARSDDADDLLGFLAVRMVLEDVAMGHVPEQARSELLARVGRQDATPDTGAVDRLSVWQEALELAYRDDLLGRLDAGARRGDATGPDDDSTPGAGDGPVEAQVVTCIDVRSEGLRRQLESTGPYGTVGFAGFFGLPVRVAGLERDPVPSCPVIVEPRATVTEVPDGDPDRAARRHDRHDAAEAAWDARHGAKAEPAAPFAFAEAAGWVLGPLAVLNTGWPGAAGRLRRTLSRRAVPDLPTRMEVGRTADPSGLTLDEQIAVAHAGLTTMGLTSGFAPLVLLCGHRSATTNNPFGAALDCGACAGKAGGPNARALAEVLNQGEVRAGLARAGITIPDQTWFVAAEHETTTDRVSVLDRHRIPGTHRDRLARLERDLATAGAALAAERRPMLPGAGGGEPATTAVGRRSDDWAEPVPEWGLVGNAAVVVGPRSLTAGIDLERRVFLHSYDAEGDPDGVALETIMTGPLVVGHWISSQYYFSTVDPRHHGAGTKPLHNVVGGIGVLEGPGGDLRTGLPLESVSFAGRRVHEPLRLLAVVRAPIERIESVIARNAAVGTLLGNGWVRLVARTDDGWSERLRDGTWTAWPGQPVEPDSGPAERGGRGRPDSGAGVLAGARGPGAAAPDLEEVQAWAVSD